MVHILLKTARVKAAREIYEAQNPDWKEKQIHRSIQMFT